MLFRFSAKDGEGTFSSRVSSQGFNERVQVTETTRLANLDVKALSLGMKKPKKRHKRIGVNIFTEPRAPVGWECCDDTLQQQVDVICCCRLLNRQWNLV